MPTPNFEDLPDGTSQIHNTCSASEPNALAARRPRHLDPIPTSGTRRRRPAPRGFNDPFDATRKDPNAWSLREAVELCKLLEVVLPEAGFHIALTGGLLFKEGRRKDCDLMFYQIRGTEPDYETLWKYLTVAGVIRSPEYPENGWLVKATYRGKAIDCLFPNASPVKKGKKDLKYDPSLRTVSEIPPPPLPETAPGVVVEQRIEACAGAAMAQVGSGIEPMPVCPVCRLAVCAGGCTPTERSIPILYHRTRDAAPYTAEELRREIPEDFRDGLAQTRDAADAVAAAVAGVRRAEAERMNRASSETTNEPF